MAGPTNDLRYKLVLQEGRNFSITLGGAQGPAGPAGPAGADGTAFVSETEPVTAHGGQFWYQPSTETLFVYSDGSWQEVSGGNAAVIISDTPPLTPEEGTLWLDSSDGCLSVWYAAGAVWIQVSHTESGSSGPIFEGTALTLNDGTILTLNDGTILTL